MNRKLFVAALLCVGALAVHAQQKAWQGIHKPTTQQLEKNFVSPSLDYANHVIWGMQGNINHDIICRNLDSIQAHGFRNIIIEPG